MEKLLLSGFRDCLQTVDLFGYSYVISIYRLPGLWLTAFFSVNLAGQEGEGNRKLDRVEPLEVLALLVLDVGSGREKESLIVKVF